MYCTVCSRRYFRVYTHLHLPTRVHSCIAIIRLSRTYLLVGDGLWAGACAFEDDDGNGVVGRNTGACYLFHRPSTGTGNTTPMSLFQTLTACDASQDDWFGSHAGMSLSEDLKMLSVCSQLDDDLVANSGACYVFQREDLAGQFRQFQKLKPHNFLHAHGRFGMAPPSISQNKLWLAACAFNAFSEAHDQRTGEWDALRVGGRVLNSVVVSCDTNLHAEMDIRPRVKPNCTHVHIHLYALTRFHTYVSTSSHIHAHAGECYLFKRDSPDAYFQQVQSLVPANAHAKDYFGSGGAVLISDNEGAPVSMLACSYRGAYNASASAHAINSASKGRAEVTKDGSSKYAHGIKADNDAGTCYITTHSDCHGSPVQTVDGVTARYVRIANCASGMHVYMRLCGGDGCARVRVREDVPRAVSKVTNVPACRALVAKKHIFPLPAYTANMHSYVHAHT